MNNMTQILKFLEMHPRVIISTLMNNTSLGDRGLHFIHLHINSILSKIVQLRFIASKLDAAVNGFSESKLNESVLYQIGFLENI